MPTSKKEKYECTYGIIKLNDYYMNKYSSSIREVIIIHEMLHVYGLKDIKISSSIMYS